MTGQPVSFFAGLKAGRTERVDRHKIPTQPVIFLRVRGPTWRVKTCFVTPIIYACLIVDTLWEIFFIVKSNDQCAIFRVLVVCINAIDEIKVAENFRDASPYFFKVWILKNRRCIFVFNQSIFLFYFLACRIVCRITCSNCMTLV